MPWIRLRAAIIALAGFAVVIGPAPARAAGEDCGTGRDSPPSIYIPNGGSCAGTLEGEQSGPWGGVSDAYHFDATVDDRIAIGFSSPNCSLHWRLNGNGPYFGSATLVGATDGRHDIWVGLTGGGGFLAPPTLGGAPRNDCWNSPLTYSMSVTVTPNTRPTITSITGPTAVPAGDPVTWAISATDPEANLASFKVKADNGVNTPWIEATASGGSATRSLTFTPTGDSSPVIRVTDSYGAFTETTRAVTLTQDDCGTGADIVSFAAPFPFTCARATLWAPGDRRDTFTFTVPAGLDRLAVDYAELSGDTGTRLTLTPPTGAPIVAIEKSILVPSPDAGGWTLELYGDPYHSISNRGTYSLAIRPLDAPAPPVLTASVTSPIHQGHDAIVSFSAVESNGRGVFFTVTWNDGPGWPPTRYPSSGYAASPAQGTARHTYAGAEPTNTIVVRATSQDGPWSEVTLTVEKNPHDDCGLGEDAKGSVTLAPTVGQVVCEGEIGYWREERLALRDTYDYYRHKVGYPYPGTDGLTITLDTLTPGLVADLSVGFSELMEVWIAASRDGSRQTVRLPAVAPRDHYIRIVLRSGLGAYRLSVERTPATLDPPPAPSRR